MIVDRLNDRAFIAASAQGTVEVIDLKTAQTVASVGGPGKPSELIYFKKCNCVAYSTSSGMLRILNPDTLNVDAEFALSGNASAVSLDPQHASVCVVHGGVTNQEEFSRISFIDLMEHKNLGEIRIDGQRLGQMVLEHHGPRGYVNNTTMNQVIVLDLNNRKVVAAWNLGEAAENVSMALDEKNHRLFIGSRKPNTLLVVDTETGKTVAHLPSSANVDDISYDGNLRRIYMSGGDGFVDVFQQEDPDSYSQIARIPTDTGAGTSKWVPEQNRLYVEVSPRKPSETGRLLVYKAVEK